MNSLLLFGTGLLMLGMAGCAVSPMAGAGATEPLADKVDTFKTPMGLYPVPSITPYFPSSDNRNGTAVIVCPGGGYGGLMDTYEGQDVCHWLNNHGITAILLRYRVAPNRYPAPLDDAQAAIRRVRSRAKEWGIDPHKIGIMGFSAGGHLAACTATLFTETDAAIDRPDFAILVYPVISLVATYGHYGSRDNLLGKNAPEDLCRQLSLETRVTDRTPPCFLIHGTNDTIVNWHNSQMFYDALVAHHIPAKLELPADAQHGFGLGAAHADTKDWMERCLSFLQDNRLLKERN